MVDFSQGYVWLWRVGAGGWGSYFRAPVFRFSFSRRGAQHPLPCFRFSFVAPYASGAHFCSPKVKGQAAVCGAAKGRRPAPAGDRISARAATAQAGPPRRNAHKVADNLPRCPEQRRAWRQFGSRPLQPLPYRMCESRLFRRSLSSETCFALYERPPPLILAPPSSDVRPKLRCVSIESAAALLRSRLGSSCLVLRSRERKRAVVLALRIIRVLIAALH